MIRRNPTRIELKLEDLEEYETLRKEIEQRKLKSSDKSEASLPVPQKSRQEVVHERIGYHPQPYSGLPTRLSF